MAAVYDSLDFAVLLWWHSTQLEVMMEKVLSAPESREKGFVDFLVMPQWPKFYWKPPLVRFLYFPVLLCWGTSLQHMDLVWTVKNLCKLSLLMIVGSWRDVSVVNSIGCFFRGPSSIPIIHIGNLQPFITPVSGDPTHSLVFVGTKHACGTQTCMLAKHSYT